MSSLGGNPSCRIHSNSVAMETGSSAGECSCVCVCVCALKWKLQGWRWGGGEEGALLCNAGTALETRKRRRKGMERTAGRKKEGKEKERKKNAEKTVGSGGK